MANARQFMAARAGAWAESGGDFPPYNPKSWIKLGSWESETQFPAIGTGVLPSQNTVLKARINCSFTGNYRSYLGCQDTTYWMLQNNNGAGYFRFFNIGRQTSFEMSQDEFHDIELDANGVSVDGTMTSATGSFAKQSMGIEIFLGGRIMGTSFNAVDRLKVNRAAFYDGSELVKDFYAALVGGVGGLWESVEGVFVPSSTGVPAEYGEDV